MEDVLQWISTLKKNKKSEINFEKELPLIELYWLLSSIYYLEYVTGESADMELQGEIDKWGDKYSLIVLFLLPVLTYVLI
jgi:hypothetical protein